MQSSNLHNFHIFEFFVRSLSICMFKPRVYLSAICICLHLHLEKDQCLPGHDYMLHFSATFLIREHTGTEDVEQVESQSVWCQKQSISWLHIHSLTIHQFTR